MENNTYNLYSKSSADVVSLADMKKYLKVDSTADDDVITALIKSVVSAAEVLMNLDILTATYENYRDDIEGDLTLRRAFFQSVSKIEYLYDGVYKTVPSANYKIAKYGVYGKVWEIEMPEGYDDHPEAIKITFKTGFGDSNTSVPADIITAIKAHVAYIYENNRGDGDPTLSDPTQEMPVSSKLIYRNHNVIDLLGV